MHTGALRSKAWRMLARLGKATLAAAAAFLVAILLTEFYRSSSLPFQNHTHAEAILTKTLLYKKPLDCRTPVLLVGNLTIDIVDKKKALVSISACATDFPHTTHVQQQMVNEQNNCRVVQFHMQLQLLQRLASSLALSQQPALMPI